MPLDRGFRRPRTPDRFVALDSPIFTKAIPPGHRILRSSPSRFAFVSGKRAPDNKIPFSGPRLKPILQDVATVQIGNQSAGPSTLELPSSSFAPESNHWLNPGDRFILLGGDDENFLPFVVEAVYRAALVPFELRVTHHGEGGDRQTEQYWIPYVESTRVFVDPGREWYRVLGPFQSVAEARELGVPEERKWWFLDARDDGTRDYPGELARERMLGFLNTLLRLPGRDAGRWQVEWMLWPGEAARHGVLGGWDAEMDIQQKGFTWLLRGESVSELAARNDIRGTPSRKDPTFRGSSAHAPAGWS